MAYIKCFEYSPTSVSDCLAKAGLEHRCQMAHAHTCYLELLHLRSGKELERANSLIYNVLHNP